MTTFAYNYETIYEFSDPANVSTLTTLLVFSDIKDFSGLGIHLRNLDVTNDVTLIVDTSLGGAVPNTGRRQTTVIGPGEEGSIEIPPPMWARYLRIAAESESPGFPVVSVEWALIGIRNARR